MTVILIVSGIIAPALSWIGYFYYKDRSQPEPVLNIAVTYILGFAAAYVCFKSYSLLPLLGLPEDASILMEEHGLPFLFYCLGVVGLLEELLKFLPFILIVVRFRAFDERVDGIIYASVIALGFASYENLHYLPLLDGFALFGRAIASPLTHTIFASIWGYSAGLAYLKYKSDKSGQARWRTWMASIIGLIIASLFHGIFDYLTTSPTLRIVSTAVILAIWVWQLRRIDKLNQEDNGDKKVKKNPDTLDTRNNKE
jgi:RsiW-degrading membrane proteinase PrsW (M82 family)